VLTEVTKPTPRPEFLERHYLIDELAEQWNISFRTLREWFADEPGVLRFGSTKLTKGKKRAYISFRVPESVAARVYRRMTGKQIHRPGGTPARLNDGL
jgi:hypothetical protein